MFKEEFAFYHTEICSYALKHLPISCHRVPKGKSSEWAAACNLAAPLKDSVRICSLHFASSDVGPEGRLRKTATPFLKIPGQQLVDIPMDGDTSQLGEDIKTKNG